MIPLAYLVTWQLFAIGGALAGVPILIHLLSRRRVRRVDWAAMAWLLAAMKRHQRRLRMENWLILLLRVAAIVLLGLALARPVLTEGAGMLARQKRSVYLVIDNSYSTAAKLDARAVIDRIQHEAELVLGAVGADDSTVVIVTNDPDEEASDGREPHVLVGRTVGIEGARRARESAATVRPRDAAANWAKTLAVVEEQLNKEDVNRHVVLITDLQAKDWLRPARERLGDEDPEAGDAPKAGPDAAADTGEPGERLRRRLERILRRPATVSVIDVGGRDRRDLAVVGVESRGRQDSFVGRSLQLAVTVANYGDQPIVGAQLGVRVDEGDRKLNFPVPDLPAAMTALRVPKPGFATVQVDLPRSTFREAGSHALHLTVTPPRTDPGADMLALSSERWLALQVRRRVRVLAWTRTSESEKQMNAEDYLRGIYEGAPAPSGATAPQGPPPRYQFEAATTESGLRARLEDRLERPVDLVVLAGVAPRSEALVDALRAYVREGGGLLVFTGEDAKPDKLNATFWSEDPAERLLPYRLAPQADVRDRGDTSEGHFGFDLTFQEDPHPLAEPFTNVRADDWIKRVPPKVWGRTTFLEPGPDEGGAEAAGDEEATARVVLRFRAEGGEAQGPAAIVAGRYGEGRTVWVGTSVDNGWLDRSVLFLPVFLDEAAMVLTRPSDAGRNLEIGGILRAGLPSAATRVRVVPPGGGAVSPRRRTPEDVETTRVEYEHDVLGRSGVWAITYETPAFGGGEPEKHRQLFAVNVDPTEGLLVAAEREAIRSGLPEALDLRFLGSYEEIGEDIKEAREGEITPFLLYAVLAILLLESFLAMRFGKRGRHAQEGSAA